MCRTLTGFKISLNSNSKINYQNLNMETNNLGNKNKLSNFPLYFLFHPTNSIQKSHS